MDCTLPCSYCSGKGIVRVGGPFTDPFDTKCPKCDGYGAVLETLSGPLNSMQVTCPDCKSELKTVGECPVCATIDPECFPLVRVINRLKGLRTVESCSGHGTTPFRIYFKAETIEALLPVLSVIAYTTWTCTAQTEGTYSQVTFCLSSNHTVLEGTLAYMETALRSILTRQETVNE